VILLFNLVCPNGHQVGGEPHEYRGPERPPEKWMDNIGDQFTRYVQTRPRAEWRCPTCGVEPAAGKGWTVETHVMKAQTMEEAHAALTSISDRIEER
jgi:hypothetical protein